MFTEKQLTFLREELATAQNPLFFYDDDPDGLCSFLILYRMHREGKGIIVKSSPKLDLKFFHKIEEDNPDKIFILDMPMVEQEFLDKVKRPVIWLDHHQPLKMQHVHYFNPRIEKSSRYFPTTAMAYEISKNPEDLWLAMVGSLADYHWPDFLEEFIEKYPGLLSRGKNIDQALYGEEIGKLVRIFAFLLKGQTSEVNKCVRILTRISSPEEILQQTTSAGRYLYKDFTKTEEKYQAVLEKAKEIKTKEKVFLFTYTGKDSFTSELAAELLYLHPKNIIIVARKKSGEMKCSLRSREIVISKIIEKALVGITGYGGGHELACGANIKEEDWEKFLEQFKEELKNVESK